MGEFGFVVIELFTELDDLSFGVAECSLPVVDLLPKFGVLRTFGFKSIFLLLKLFGELFDADLSLLS